MESRGAAIHHEAIPQTDAPKTLARRGGVVARAEDVQKWTDAQDVQIAGEARALARRVPEDFEQNGLVIQQRYFMKLHRWPKAME